MVKTVHSVQLIELELVTVSLFDVSLPPKLESFPTSIKQFCSVELLCIHCKVCMEKLQMLNRLQKLSSNQNLNFIWLMFSFYKIHLCNTSNLHSWHYITVSLSISDYQDLNAMFNLSQLSQNMVSYMCRGFNSTLKLCGFFRDFEKWKLWLSCHNLGKASF